MTSRKICVIINLFRGYLFFERKKAMRTMVCFNYLKSERCYEAVILGKEKYGFASYTHFRRKNKNHCKFAT